MSRALIVLQNEGDRDKACRWAQGVPLGSRVEFKETKRSLPQNDLMWALLTEVAQQLEHGGRKYDADQWKSIFLHGFGREVTFLPSLDLKTFLPIELSSSDLGKEEMTNFIEFILKEGAERGVIFKDPHNESSDAPPPPASVDGDAAPPASLEPPAQNPSVQAGGSDLFKFQFAEGELIHLCDFARKALDDASSDSDTPAKEAEVDRLFASYREVITSEDGKQAMNAMGVPLAAVINGKRSREVAADYIARDLLGCDASALEGWK